MKNKPLFLVVATLLAFFALAPITGCTPKKDGDLIKHCDNLVKDEDETGIDCGGSCNPCVLPCDTIVCQNGGTCNNGNCNCPAGYTGNRCQTEVRSAYTGSYLTNGTGVETPGGATVITFTNFQVAVTPVAGNVNSLMLTMGTGSIINLSALLQSNNTSFTIPPQVQGIYTYQGSGSFTINSADTIIAFNFTEAKTASPDTSIAVTLTGPKQ